MKAFKILLIAIPLITSGAEARRKRSSASEFPNSFPVESYLTEQIKASGLSAKLPAELEKDCAGQDKTKVWTQLMIGLSYVESNWRAGLKSSVDVDSNGLFQMTGPRGKKSGDIAGGKPCFKSAEEAKDPKKNSLCAVNKMKDLMASHNSSLKSGASKYWGPFGSKQWRQKGKGGSLVAMVAASCKGKAGSLDDTNGDTKGLASNDVEYWGPIGNYTPYELNERSPASSRQRQAAR